MQIRVTFELLRPGQLLPFSYQYPLSSWIYRLIGRSNSAFSDFLHNEGYGEEGKRFKLFTFSRLKIQDFQKQGDRMKIFSPHISFVISFLAPQAAEEAIMGMFHQEEEKIGDQISQIQVRVKTVQMLREPEFSLGPITISATSPIMVSRPDPGKDGKTGHKYLSPLDQDYETYFFNNLLNKHQEAVAHNLARPIEENPHLRFRLLSQSPRKNLIIIRANTPEQTKIVGYLFDFELEAPAELVRVGLLAGFGGKNALGFGAGRVVNEK